MSRHFLFRRFFILLILVVCIPLSGLELSGQDSVKPATENAGRPTPSPIIRYPLGPDSKAQEGVPKGRLEGPHLFHSKIIENTVRKYWVYVPAQYDESKPACVLVFQDGARATNPGGVLRVQQVLENLIAKKQIPVTIGIFITPGQRGDEFPDSIGTGNPNNRDREYDVLNDTYARFLIDEMLPEVEKKYNLTDDPRGRAIGGSSSGAICAFTVAWERPDAFQNVVSLIGSYTNIHGGHVYPDLVLKEDKKPIRIFLQDGVNDLRSPQNLERDWHIQNQKMVAAFKAKGYDMAHVFGEGGHSDDHGGAMLPEMLKWIWRDYSGVQSQGAEEIVAAAKAIQPERTELFPGFDKTATVDPSGTYKWSRRGRFAVEQTLAIENQDGKLTGSLETKRGDEDPVEADVKNAAMIGNKLLFEVTARFGDREFPVHYQGIVDGDSITGWQIMSFGGSQRDFRWTAHR